MMKSVTSSIELEELLAEHQNLALLVSGNQCSLSSLGQKELIDTAEREHLVLYQADVFQVTRLISLFGIQPTRVKNTHAVWHAAARIRSTASLNFVGFVYASKLTKVSFLG